MLDYLEELYYGAFPPASQCGLAENPELTELRVKLEGRLGGEEKQLLDRLFHFGRGMTNQAVKEAFFEGFRMGAGLMLQIFP